MPRSLAIVALALAVSPSAQTWAETCGKSPAGIVALQQAVTDAKSDALVLVVASHPDDRYVLPAVWLSYRYGARIAVLLATRGGGGQNTVGPESGDALERIRTLETEAGCARFAGTVWYLNRPDGGYRRTAEETFAEWGEGQTLHDLVELIRRIRPDVVLTTHNEQEQHGHDVALVQLLAQAVPLAGSADYACEGAPHQPYVFAIGATGAAPGVVSIPMDRLEPVRGESYRQLAYSILAEAHVTPGPPSPLESVFPPELSLEIRIAGGGDETPIGTLPSVFDAEHWRGDAARGAALDRFLRVELPAAAARHEGRADAIAALGELRALSRGADPGSDFRLRLDRRIEALERVVANLSGLKIVLGVAAGTHAIEGEEFEATVQVNVDEPLAARMSVEGVGGVVASLEAEDGGPLVLRSGGAARARLLMRLPLSGDTGVDPMGERFRAARFEPPIRVCFQVALTDVELPIALTVPVEERAPVEVSAVPRMLLLPESRRELQFSVNVVRNSRLPVETKLEVRAPAGYAIRQDVRDVILRDRRSDLFGFDVVTAESRRPGVDVLRITVADMSVALPVHKVDVVMPPLRVGVLRSRDDSLTGILGVGGLGLAWSELSDADIAAGDLSSFDTIVVDVRALRDRPGARRGFRRLLEFARGKGHRLVVFYHKDFEFNPPREGFAGAPYQLQIGKDRVTRADAPVRTLVPEHVLLTHPNRLNAWDWDGWDQERALYLPSVYASQFEEVIELHDPGQQPERGALLYAHTGDGEYVYCALALWRQLKKLHPGAVRLLANLLTPASTN
ncbi:MAG: PIG-L family deacetylase [Planctomycetota bacterium]